MISQTTEYALRAVVCLAEQHETPLTTAQIAQTTRVPAGYLSKVLQSLGRHGLVRAQRGLHGGFTLASAPNEMSVLQVINAVEPIQRITECPLGIKSHGRKLCSLHQRIDDAMAMIERAFGTSTIADLIRDASDRRPLCEAPGAEKVERPERNDRLVRTGNGR